MKGLDELWQTGEGLLVIGIDLMVLHHIDIRPLHILFPSYRDCRTYVRNVVVSHFLIHLLQLVHLIVPPTTDSHSSLATVHIPTQLEAHGPIWRKERLANQIRVPTESSTPPSQYCSITRSGVGPINR